ncbi:ATP-dependent DNA helicase PIF1-like protein [Tanacetum coccineum]
MDHVPVIVLSDDELSTDYEIDVCQKTMNHKVEQLFDAESKDDSQDVDGITDQTTYNLTHSNDIEDDVNDEHDYSDSFINDGSLDDGSTEDDNDSDELLMKENHPDQENHAIPNVVFSTPSGDELLNIKKTRGKQLQTKTCNEGAKTPIKLSPVSKQTSTVVHSDVCHNSVTPQPNGWTCLTNISTCKPKDATSTPAYAVVRSVESVLPHNNNRTKSSLTFKSRILNGTDLDKTVGDTATKGKSIRYKHASRFMNQTPVNFNIDYIDHEILLLNAHLVVHCYVVEPPPMLKELITNKHPKSDNFIENIRRYNSMFTFASMGGKQDTSVNVGQEGSLSENNKLEYKLTIDICDLLDEINLLVKDFRMADERIRSSDDQKISLKLIGTRQRDRRQNNLPTTSEVAALVVGDFDSTEHKRDIILYEDNYRTDRFHEGIIDYDEKTKEHGPDRVSATIDGEEVDEIKDYLNCRYLSACEAAWRIYRFGIHYRTPFVKRLPFHLKDEQQVIFDATESIDYAIDKSFCGKKLGVMAADVLSVKRIKQDLELSDIQRKNICLTYIECMLQSNNSSLKDIQNMSYPDQEHMMDGYNRLIYDETSYNPDKLREQHAILYGSLTPKQKGIYSTVINAVDNNKGGMFFVYGYGGTEKTYLYKTMTDLSVASDKEKAILSPTHEMVDIINQRMLTLLRGDEKEYESLDSVCLDDVDSNFDDPIYTLEFLNSLRMFGIPHHSIKLKIGTPIMLTHNIDQRAELCNGTRIQVLRMGNNIIEAKIISGGSVGAICTILRMIITRPTPRCRSN